MQCCYGMSDIIDGFLTSNGTPVKHNSNGNVLLDCDEVVLRNWSS